MRVTLKSLPQQILRTQHALSVPGLRRRSCPQVKVIRGEIGGRTLCRTKHFRRLESGFDHSSDAQRDAILKVKYILHWTVKAISPQMGAADRINQLCGNAHAVSSFAHRTLQHVTYAEFSTDLLHIDRPPLVGEARIAGDHEEPADATERGDDLLDGAVREIVLPGIAAHVLE